MLVVFSLITFVVGMPPPGDGFGDIRNFLSPARGTTNAPAVRPSPQPTPSRRRRVHDSDLDDSDHAQPPVTARNQAPQSTPPRIMRGNVAAVAVGGHAQPAACPVEVLPASANNAPVIIASSSSDDDDMWVRPWSRPADRVHSAARSLQASTVDVRAQRSTRQRLCAVEAVEDDCDDDNSSADESDDDAVDLYRSAMLGVRNRPNALHQVRASTTPCAACAHFAKFRAYFM